MVESFTTFCGTAGLFSPTARALDRPHRNTKCRGHTPKSQREGYRFRVTAFEGASEESAAQPDRQLVDDSPPCGDDKPLRTELRSVHAELLAKVRAA